MLEIRSINKFYKLKSINAKHALKNISLKFDNIGLVAIIGKSGSGKSTLLNVLGNLDNFDDGEIFINGKSTVNFSKNEWDSIRNTLIGFIFQDYYLIDSLSVGENIKLALELKGQNNQDIRDRVNEALNIVELKGFYDNKVYEISGGEKQRVVIARALVKEPKIILADEPTGNLDSTSGENIFQILKKLSGNKLVIIVTHDEGLAHKYADRIIKLKDGEVIEDYYTNKHYKKNIDSSQKTHIDLCKSLLPWKYVIHLGLNYLFLKKFRLVLMLILFILSLIFVNIATTFSFYNSNHVSYLTFKKQNINKITLKKYQNDDIYSIYDDEIISLKKKYSDLTFVTSIMESNDYVGSCIFNLPYEGKSLEDSNCVNKVSLIENEKPNLKLLKGKYPLENNSIYITDYMAEMLVKYQVFERENLLNGVINVNNKQLVISGVVETNYQKYFKNDIKVYLEKNVFHTEMNETFQEVFMTKETFEDLFYTYTKIVEDDDQSLSSNPNTITIINSINNNDIIGRIPQNDDEIVIYLSSIKTYLDDKFIELNATSEDIEKYINRTITFDLSKYDKFKGLKVFTVVGILNDKGYSPKYNFIVTKPLFEYFLYSNSINDQGKIKTLTVYFGDNKENIKGFLKEIQSLNYKHVTPYSSEIYQLKSITDKFDTVFYIVGGVFTFFTSLMIFTFITNNILEKRKDIGILRALGARSIDVIKIFIVETFFIALISITISTFSSIMIINYLNKVSENNLNMNIVLIYVDIWSILFSILLTIFIIFLATFIPFRKLRKIPPIKVIKAIE